MSLRFNAVVSCDSHGCHEVTDVVVTVTADKRNIPGLDFVLPKGWHMGGERGYGIDDVERYTCPVHAPSWVRK